MINISDLKPWFRDDLERLLTSIYFTSKAATGYQTGSQEYHTGFVAALSSIALMVGVSPDVFLAESDLPESLERKRSDKVLDHLLQSP